MGSGTPSAWLVHGALQRQPVTTANALCAATGLSPATVNKTLERMAGLGLVEETTARMQGRIFAYRGYVELLNAGL